MDLTNFSQKKYDFNNFRRKSDSNVIPQFNKSFNKQKARIMIIGTIMIIIAQFFKLFNKKIVFITLFFRKF